MDRGQEELKIELEGRINALKLLLNAQGSIEAFNEDINFPGTAYIMLIYDDTNRQPEALDKAEAETQLCKMKETLKTLLEVEHEQK